MNDDVLLTREQIGLALDYTDPMVAIGKIHNRHKDRLDILSFTTLVNGRNTYCYTQKGIMEICRWSNSKKADLFMDWCWDIIEKYRNGDLNTDKQQDITPILEAITNLADKIINLTEKQEQQSIPQRRFSRWFARMSPKYDLLMDYFNINRIELYRNLYIELEEMYPDVDIQQLQDDYCYENGIDKCFPLDAIEHNKPIRDLFETLVDSLLESYQLKPESNTRIKRHTIFDDCN